VTSSAAALLALALAAQAGEPCIRTDARGRTFVVCFDPGNRLELTAGGVLGGREPVRGGASEVGAAMRWRRDAVTRSGSVEWVRDMTLGEARARFTSGDTDPRAAAVLAWRGTFVRHRASPFVLVPGPRPFRVPFPFDVGLLAEFGGAAWDASRRRELDVIPVRSALLFDLAARARLRRLAFGPEVSWAVHVAKGAQPVHRVVPFSGGVVDALAESADGLLAARLTLRGGSSLSVPGGAETYLEASAGIERVVLAVNDRPVAIYAEGAVRGGASGRGAEAGVGLRIGLLR
jgi:hypothetical protein